MRIPTHVLRHRATISRRTEVWQNGMPSFAVVQVASGEPCLLDTIGTDFVISPSATANEIAESDKHGTLFVGPSSSAVWDAEVPVGEREVRPGDTLTISTAPIPTRVTALAAPSRVEGWDGPSHREIRVKEV